MNDFAVRRTRCTPQDVRPLAILPLRGPLVCTCVCKAEDLLLTCTCTCTCTCSARPARPTEWPAGWLRLAGWPSEAGRVLLGLVLFSHRSATLHPADCHVFAIVVRSRARCTEDEEMTEAQFHPLIDRRNSKRVLQAAGSARGYNKERWCVTFVENASYVLYTRAPTHSDASTTLAPSSYHRWRAHARSVSLFFCFCSLYLVKNK